MTGHIKLDRKILSWEWYNDINTCRLFIHLLLTANYANGNWQGRSINRGELITGLHKLSEKTGLTMRQTRTSLNKLKTTGEITINSTNKFSTITICNYDSYQSNKKHNDNQIDTPNANERQTNDKQTTTNNKNKNNKEEEYNNRGAGGFAPPTPPQVSGFNYLPDGRSYIEPTIFFTKADFNGLPDSKSKEVVRFLKTTKDIDVDESDISALWLTFKEMELTFQKPYRNIDDVYRHFLNWTKKQSFGRKKLPTPRKSKEKVVGVKWVNEFTECEMSDGTIKKLTINQQDGAKYNQINPSSIAK